MDYLRRLRATVGGPLTVLWDGSRVHDRAKAAQAFLADHPDVRTERLPAYAPELNPDELVWAWIGMAGWATWRRRNTGWLRDYIITELNYMATIPSCWLPSSRKPTCRYAGRPLVHWFRRSQ